MNYPAVRLSVALSADDVKALSDWQIRYYWAVRDATVRECFSSDMIERANIAPEDRPDQVLWKLRNVALRLGGAEDNQTEVKQ